MNKTDKLKLCKGCLNDYYNSPGNSENGECWLLANSKVVERVRVGIWQNPPYRWRPQTTLQCHSPDGSAWLERGDCRVVDDSDESVAEWNATHIKRSDPA